MAIRKANATWEGGLKSGKGIYELPSQKSKAPYSFSSRFEEGTGSNPEELIGAAHAGCFSMALSADLEGAGYSPESVNTEAAVHLEKDDKGPAIVKIVLTTEAKIPGINNDEFQKFAEGAKKNCPVSKALAGPNIELKAKLV